MVNMLEPKGYQATNDLGHSQTIIPEGEARCLLAFCIVLTADQHQRRANRGFEDTQEDTGRQEGRIVFGSCGGCSGNSPKSDIYTEPLGGGDFLQTVD